MKERQFLFDISELDLHGLTIEELSNRWKNLRGLGRLEIIERSFDSARVRKEILAYMVAGAATTKLTGLPGFLLKSEMQTIVDVLAHKGTFTDMHAASQYNAQSLG